MIRYLLVRAILSRARSYLLIYLRILNFLSVSQLLLGHRPETKREVAVCDCRILHKRVEVYSIVYCKLFLMLLQFDNDFMLK